MVAAQSVGDQAGSDLYSRKCFALFVTEKAHAINIV